MDYKFGWSMHPQFKIMDGALIEIKGCPGLYVDFSTKYNFGSARKKYKWPYAIDTDNKKIDFSRITDIDDGSLTKLYLSDMQGKVVNIYYKEVQHKLGVQFDSDNAGFYGIAINKGGWPFNGRPYKWIGIEPCNCITDKLSDSIKRGIFGLLKQNRNESWEVTLVIN